MDIYTILSAVLLLLPMHISCAITLSNWTQTSATLNSYLGRACGYKNNLEEEILIFGGFGTPNKYTDAYYDVISYSITNDHTQSLAPLSNVNIACFGRCYTQYNDKLYFIYWYKFGIYNMEQLEITYPLSQNRVNSYGPKSCIAISYDGVYIFSVGGQNAATKLNTFQIYNVDEGIVLNGPNMNTIRSSLNCAVVSNNYLYAIGGDDGSVHLDNIEKIYVGNIDNIELESWQLLDSTMTIGINHHECVVFNQYIYILGGDATNGVSVSTVIALDTDTDTLYQDTSLPVAMSDLCAVITEDDRVFVADKENIYWASIIQSTSPTVYPTEYPSHPTFNPTENPTSQPSNPTLNPSLNPTLNPSVKPTINPTMNPTTYTSLIHSISQTGTYPLAETTTYDRSTRYYTNNNDDTIELRMSKPLIYIAIIICVLLFITCIYGIKVFVQFIVYYLQAKQANNGINNVRADGEADHATNQ